MNSVSWKKVAGWSGLIYVLFFVASSVFVADSPAPGQSAVEFREWFESSQIAIAWTTWGGGLSLSLLFLLFASGLRSLLKPLDEGHAGMWSRLSFAGAILMVAIGTTKATFWAVLSLDDIRSSSSDNIIKTLAAFDGVAVGALLPWGVSAFLLGASVVILQSGVMAKWLGWLGFFTVFLFVIGTLWLFTGNMESMLGMLTLVGYLGFLLWTIAAAISLLRSEDSYIS